MKILWGLYDVIEVSNDGHLVATSSLNNFGTIHTVKPDGIIHERYNDYSVVEKVSILGVDYYLCEDRLDNKWNKWLEDMGGNRRELNQLELTVFSSYLYGKNEYRYDHGIYGVPIDKASSGHVKYNFNTMVCRPTDIGLTTLNIKHVDRDLYHITYDSAYKMYCGKTTFGGDGDWSFTFDGEPPSLLSGETFILFEDRVLINLCVQKKWMKRFDGEIHLRCDNTGELIWKKIYPYQIDGIAKVNSDVAAVYCGNVIELVNIHSGDVVEQLTTEFDVADATAILFCHNDVLYLQQDEQNCLCLYDAHTLEKRRRVDFEPYGVMVNARPTVINGKVYIRVSMSDYPATWSLLEIDPEQLDAELIPEPRPEFTITTPDSEPGPVIIEFTEATIDRVIRIGEMEVSRMMVKSGEHIWNENPNLNFNGEVLLRCNGLLCTKERATELLDIMTVRMNAFAKENGVYNGHGKDFAQMCYQLT